MKLSHLATPLLLILLVACNAKEEGGVSDTSSATSANAKTVWNSARFPLTVKLASAFSASERLAIKDMGAVWTDEAAPADDFFNLNSVTTNKASVSDLDSLFDSELGVYKATNWHRELPSSALAVTQIYGVRRNGGQANEYVEIVHADILVNYDDHNFSTDLVSNGYDLQTVMLHELGHFIGLKHNSSSSSSIMYPSISSLDVKRTPSNADTELLQSNYGISGGGASSQAIRNTNRAPMALATPDEVFTQGPVVKITLELRADGHCVHREGEHVIETHKAHVPKR